MWALVFLLDHERRRRRSLFLGFLVGVLTVAGHLWLSGSWMQRAGLHAEHPPAAAAAGPAGARSPFDFTGAAQDALAELTREARVPARP